MVNPRGFQDWQLADPSQQPEIFPQVRDQVKARVEQLVQTLMPDQAGSPALYFQVECRDESRVNERRKGTVGYAATPGYLALHYICKALRL